LSVAVYVPLLLSVLAAVSAQRIAGRLEPVTATWLLTASAVVLAAASLASLAALALTVIGQVPELAAHAHWSPRVLRRDDPIWLPVAVTACILLGGALAAACRVAARCLCALGDAARTSGILSQAGRLTVVDDPAPKACAVPGRPGRIVVSTGMLDALDDQEQQVLIAHEGAHLAGGHYLFVTLARVAAAANPVLRPLAAAVRYTVERSADEHAARQVGSRRLTARTIGKAALLTRAARAGRPAGLLIAASALRGTGPVPRRVAALLAPPPGRRPLLLIAALALLIVAGVTTLEAARDVHVLFETATAVRLPRP
jgi:Zn-dependent protease with chaperone function